MQKTKNSGVPWIGEIPDGWEISKVKYCFTLNVGLSITKEHLCQNGIKCLNYGYIHGKNTTELSLDKDNLPFVPTTYLETHSKCLIHNGDFVFCDTSEDIEGSGNFVYILNDCEEKIFAGSHTIACKKTKPFNSSFLAYLCSTDIWKSQIQSKVTGTKVYSITQKILKEALVFFPPLQDQQRIADFLDEKCTQINDTIAKKKELIEKLKEYRQSIITEAVTKGLNPTAPMKDSGIDWIGEIPKHWEIYKLKHITELITDGTHFTPTYIESGIPFLSIKDISQGFIDFSDTKFISEYEHKILSQRAPVAKGDILFTRIGTLGVAMTVDVDTIFDIFVSLGLIKIKKSIVTSTWIVYCMISQYYFNYIQQVKAGGGTAAAKFNLGDVAMSPIVLPKTQEQQKISSHLDKKTALIDNAIQQKEQLIERLNQYKKSLIYEAVTGKIEV